MTIQSTYIQRFRQELNNKLSNFSDYVQHAHAINGLANVILKGKTVRKKPKGIEFKQRTPIQPEILKHHPELPIHNFFFHQQTPIFHHDHWEGKLLNN